MNRGLDSTKTLHLMLLPTLLVLSFSGSVLGQGGALPRSTPESQGVSSPKILEFIEAADQQVQSMHSFMLVRVFI